MSFRRLFFHAAIIVFLTQFWFTIGCHSDKPDIRSINPPFDWIRFDSILVATPTDSIESVVEDWRRRYAFLLDNPLSDSALAVSIVEFKSSPLVIEAFREINKQYPDLSSIRHDLELAFRFLLFYYPEFKVPKIYTYVSGFDFNYPVKYADSAMAIGLDMYLGQNFHGYRALGIPAYKQRQMRGSNIAQDCMVEVYLAKFSTPKSGSTLLDYLVEAGKKYCFVEHMIPAIADSTLLRYSKVQWEWCEKNEANIWAFILEQQLLFSNDREKVGKFMMEAPFTPGFAKESPGRMADFIGWKLMKAYSKNNPESTLPQMIMVQNSRAILDGSGYKP